MKILAYWNSHFLKVSLCEEKVKFRRSINLRKSFSKSGWAYKQNKKWFAVYEDNNRLLFRCDDVEFEISSEFKCTLERGSTLNTFVLKANENVVFRFEYRPSMFFAKHDSTFDTVDLESDDFFEWLSYIWTDPMVVKDVKSLLKISH